MINSMSIALRDCFLTNQTSMNPFILIENRFSSCRSCGAMYGSLIAEYFSCASLCVPFLSTHQTSVTPFDA